MLHRLVEAAAGIVRGELLGVFEGKFCLACAGFGMEQDDLAVGEHVTEFLEFRFPSQKARERSRDSRERDGRKVPSRVERMMEIASELVGCRIARRLVVPDLLMRRQHDCFRVLVAVADHAVLGFAID